MISKKGSAQTVVIIWFQMPSAEPFRNPRGLLRKHELRRLFGRDLNGHVAATECSKDNVLQSFQRSSLRLPSSLCLSFSHIRLISPIFHHFLLSVFYLSIIFFNKMCLFFFGGRLKNLRGTGTKNFGLMGLPPRILIYFGPFVYYLWRILLLFFIFLSFSLFFSLLFLPPWNFRGGGRPPTIFWGGHVPPLPPPMLYLFINLLLCYPLSTVALWHYSTDIRGVWKQKKLSPRQFTLSLKMHEWNIFFGKLLKQVFRLQ